MADAQAQATADQPIAPIAFKKRSAKAKAQFRKKEPSPPPAASDSDSEYTSDEEGGREIKRRRKNVTVTASSAKTRREPVEDNAAVPAQSRPSLPTGNDATKQSNWYDEGKDEELSAKNLLGKTRSGAEFATIEPDGKYRGTANYTSFIQKNPNAPTKQVGPIKAPTNIRTITVTDFAPDVCKDYKQTGFCGFGDTCKFLHAREDYKQGWELDRDWEIQTKGKKLEGRTVSSRNQTGQADDDDEEDELLESIPFACIICRGQYKNPVVTKCGHYFCESCALQRYRKNPSCAACGTGTGGVFNTAKKLNKLLERKRERARQRRQRAIEAGDEVSEEEEEEVDGSD